MTKRTLHIFAVFCLFFGATVTYAQHTPYWGEIQAFKRHDSISAPPKHAILFVGSSSFRLWKDVQKDFPNHVIINRGFGGSSLTDVIRYADDIIFPYQPKQIVIYCGENDLSSSDSVAASVVFDRFTTLFKMIRGKDSRVNVTFVSIKPSPSREKIRRKVIEVNAMISDYLKQHANTSFVNVYDLMIDVQGHPQPKLFREDMLHMKPEGYVIWKKAIEPYLIK